MAAASGSINKNANLVGVLTGLSRVFGLVREMLTSRLIGSGVEQSAFVFAFTIPNLFRKLFGEGALSSAFIPVFKNEQEIDGKSRAEAMARAVSSMVTLLLSVICVLGLLGICCALPYTETGGKANSVLRLTRIMLP